MHRRVVSWLCRLLGRSAASEEQEVADRMNLRGNEVPPAESEGSKRKIHEVGQQLPIDSDLIEKLPIAVDKYGAINFLTTDKFGAVESLEGGNSSSDHRIECTEDSSTGPFTAFEKYTVESDADRQSTGCARSGESSWSKYIDTGAAATSFTCSSNSLENPQSNSSTPRSCTVDERTSSSSRSPPLKRFCASSYIDRRETELKPRRSHIPLLDIKSEQQEASQENGNDHKSLTLNQEPVDTRGVSSPTVRFNIGGTILLPGSPPLLQNIQPPLDIPSNLQVPINLNELPGPPAIAPGSEVSMHSQDSGNEHHEGYGYRFASAGREAFLLQRMEERQDMQDAGTSTMHTSWPSCSGVERGGYVVSPEDLIWRSVKNYCGMVLDRETHDVLGNAVLFIPADPGQQGSHFPRSGKAAWVTCVNVVEGRREVLIRNSKGGIHEAHLMLTSTALGVALFSVHNWRGTFGLAFLSRVTGPASLPHRQFVDVNRGDRAYVFGYDELGEFESRTPSDVKVRRGQITDAGTHNIVEIDFTAGTSGGLISTPSGFTGGLIVRADGLWAGVITGTLNFGTHHNLIDFCSSYNVYSLLEEL